MKLAVQSRHVFAWAGALLALAALGALCTGCFCDSWTFAYAWVDTNCDGYRGVREDLLPGVCVWVSDWPTDPSSEYCTWDGSRTDEEGRWQSGMISGCSTRWYVVAQTPPGFEPTTDTALVRVMRAGFGFAPEGTCPPRAVVTPDKVAQNESTRRVVWVLAGVALVVLPLLALGFRKLRRDSLARQQRPSGE